MSALDRILDDKATTFEEAAENTVVDRILVDPGMGQFQPVQTREVEIPRVVPAEEGLGFGRSLRMGFIDDPEARVRQAARDKFPDDPDALKRFGIVGSDIVFVNDDGLLEKVSGGAADTAGNIAALSPEIAGSIVGSFATGNPVSGSAIGAAGGRALKDIIGGALFEDPTTTMGVLKNMSVEAATDLVAAGLGKVFTKAATRKSVTGVDDTIFKSDVLRQQVKGATGIELDLAQVTNLPKLKALKRWATNFPGEAAEIMQASTEIQKGQVDDAIQRLLRVVAEEADAGAMGIKGINAAEAAIAAARVNVADVVQPLYKQAFEEGVPVNVAPVLEVLTSKLDIAKGSRRKTLLAVRKLFNQAGDDKALDTSLEGLHSTKLAIDEMLERRGSDALGRTVKRDLVELKKGLLQQMSEASPTYDVARQRFQAETARLVDPLQNGIVGVIADIPERQAAQAAAKMFAGGNVTPGQILRAKRAISGIEGGDEAWNGLVRQWLSDRFVKASREIQIGEEANLAGKFRQGVVGTRQQKAAMIAALGDDARELFDITMEALQMVARTPVGSSATEFNAQITREMTGGTGSLLRAGAQPLGTVVQAIDENHLQRMAVKIAEALTDPAKVNQLRVLKEISPSTERAVIASSVIGLSILPRDATGNLLFPPDTLIPPILNEAGNE